MPAGVPLLFHSSTPLVPSSAVKYRRPLTLVRFWGSQVAGRSTVSTRAAPRAGSLRHSSGPVPSSATKKSVPFTSVRLWGFELAVPPKNRLMSRARTAPDRRIRIAAPELDTVRPVVGGEVEHAIDVYQVRRIGRVRANVDVLHGDRTGRVPSLFHSSVPVGAAELKSDAVKNNVPFTVVRFCGLELRPSRSGPAKKTPGLMSLSKLVPRTVPSLFQSSRPIPGLDAEKKSVPFASVRMVGAPGPCVRNGDW